MATTNYKKVDEMHTKYPLAFGYVDKVLTSAAKVYKTRTSSGLFTRNKEEETMAELRSHLYQLSLHLQNDGYDLKPGTYEKWFAEVEIAYPNWKDAYETIYIFLAYARGER